MHGGTPRPSEGGAQEDAPRPSAAWQSSHLHHLAAAAAARVHRAGVRGTAAEQRLLADHLRPRAVLVLLLVVAVVLLLLLLSSAAQSASQTSFSFPAAAARVRSCARRTSPSLMRAGRDRGPPAWPTSAAPSHLSSPLVTMPIQWIGSPARTTCSETREPMPSCSGGGARGSRRLRVRLLLDARGQRRGRAQTSTSGPSPDRSGKVLTGTPCPYEEGTSGRSPDTATRCPRPSCRSCRRRAPGSARRGRMGLARQRGDARLRAAIVRRASMSRISLALRLPTSPL